MNYFKKIGISLGISLIAYLLLLIFVSLFSYLNILKGTLLTIFKLFIPLISLFIGSFSFGKKANKKGWLEGIKFGFIYIIIFILINLIFYHNFSISKFIFYIILLITSTLGSMLGITKKIKS